MRRKLTRAVRQEFKQRLKDALPMARKVSSAKIPLGWSLFELTADPDLKFFLMLAIARREDEFTVECAWSKTGEFPARIGLMHPRDFAEAGIRRDEPKGGAFRFRLAYLWQPRDYWWELAPRPSWEQVLEQQNRFIETGALPEAYPEEKALRNVTPMVADAVDRIVRYAMPYSREIAQESSGQ